LIFIPIFLINRKQGGSTSIEEQIHNLSLIQHQILNQLPAFVVHIKLTPSLTTEVKDVRFQKLMDALNLDSPNFKKVFQKKKQGSLQVLISCGFGARNQSEAYEPFCEALCDSNSSRVAVKVKDSWAIPFVVATQV
jgi:hypothetical protein